MGVSEDRMVLAAPRPGEHVIRTDDLVQVNISSFSMLFVLPNISTLLVLGPWLAITILKNKI